MFSKPDSAVVLSQELLQFGEEKQYVKAKSKAFQLMGIVSAIKSDYPKSLGFLEQSFAASEEAGDLGQMAKVISNMGNIYRKLGNESKALDNYQRSLDIFNKIGAQAGSANSNTCIGVIYGDRGDYDRSLEYFQRSLRIHDAIGDKINIANVSANIGDNYFLLGDTSKALEYLKKSLTLYQELRNNSGSANTLASMGRIHSELGMHDQALTYFDQSLKLQEDMGDKVGRASTLNSIGKTYLAQEKYKIAEGICMQALALAEEFRALVEEKIACECLYESYKSIGNAADALIYMEKIQVIDDSLNVEETNKKLQQMEFAKEMLADSLQKEEEKLRVQATHDAVVRKKNKTKNIAFGLGLFLLIIAGGLYSRNRYVRKSRDIISKEKDRSENLLLNILPEEIAEELKTKGRADAKDFDMVSILFTDFKGFTAASEKLSAQDLVSEINTCFEAFDGIMGKYNIEKIKTIGDAYMAAGGLPVPDEDSIKNTVLAGLEIQSFIKKRKEELEKLSQPAFEMRVGIHTGPVVAGIVGVKKFQYDIWGDTVNTASRMESSGEVGKVNISRPTYDLLKEDPQFTFESRGRIEAKGKGKVEMYFVSVT